MTTIKEAKRELASIAITLTKDDEGEFRVNFRGGKEATAYYTNDLDDAIGTGKELAKWKAAHG